MNRTNAHPPIRVVVVDDDPFARDALATYVRNAPDLCVVGTFGNGAEAVAALETQPADVVLMDVRMPVMDGVTATGRIARDGSAKVILVTTFDHDDRLAAGLEAGAFGFLLKNESPDAVINAVRSVHHGNSVLASDTLTRLIRTRGAAVRAQQPSALSDREAEVLRLLGEGLSNATIASRLFLSQSTVKSHLTKLFKKLNVNSRLEAVVRARQSGLVEPRE